MIDCFQCQIHKFANLLKGIQFFLKINNGRTKPPAGNQRFR